MLRPHNQTGIPWTRFLIFDYVALVKRGLWIGGVFCGDCVILVG